MSSISFTAITDGSTIDASDVNTPLNTIYDDYNGGIDSNNLADNAVTTAKITDANVTTDKIADDAVTPAKAGDLAKAVNRQDNTTDSVVTDQLIQYGWGFIQVGAVSSAHETVTFPVAYDSAPIVVCSFLGKKTSDPTTVGDTTSLHDATTSAKPYTIAAASFVVYINTEAAFTNNDRAIYSWIAIGTKAR